MGQFSKVLLAIDKVHTLQQRVVMWVLRFWENEGSKRSKINEKGGQLDWKSRRKLIQNA